MGGYGSGYWLGSDKKKTTESNRRIDIRYMKRQGMLKSGTVGLLSWTRNGKQNGDINFCMERDQLILSYRYRFWGGEWEEVEQLVYFDRTACNYGGERIWLLCPHCLRRVLLLYGAGKYFLCRHCHNLTYATQQERKKDRLIKKAQAIRERLGGSRNLLEPFPKKPKGMHWKTYWRLYSEAEKASFISWSMFLDEVSPARNGNGDF